MADFSHFPELHGWRNIPHDLLAQVQLAGAPYRVDNDVVLRNAVTGAVATLARLWVPNWVLRVVELVGWGRSRSILADPQVSARLRLGEDPAQVLEELGLPRPPWAPPEEG